MELGRERDLGWGLSLERPINPIDLDLVRVNSGENRELEGAGPNWEICRGLAEGERSGPLDPEHLVPKRAL